MNRLALFLVATSSLFCVVGCGSQPQENTSPSSPAVVGNNTPGKKEDPLNRYPDGAKVDSFAFLTMLPPRLESCTKGEGEMVYPFTVNVPVRGGGEYVPLSPGMLVGPTENKVIPGWNFTGANLYSYATEVYPMGRSYPGVSCTSSGECPEGYVCAHMSVNFKDQDYFGDKQCVRPLDIPFATKPNAFGSLIKPPATGTSNTQAKKQVVTFVFETSKGFSEAFSGGSGNYSGSELLTVLLRDRFLRRYKSALNHGGSSAEFRFVFAKYGGVLECINSEQKAGSWIVEESGDCKKIDASSIETLFGSLDGARKPDNEFKGALGASHGRNKSYSLLHRAVKGLNEQDENIIVLVTAGPNNNFTTRTDVISFKNLKQELLAKQAQLLVLQYDSSQSIPMDNSKFDADVRDNSGPLTSFLTSCKSQDDCYSNEECRTIFDSSAVPIGSDKYCRPKLSPTKEGSGVGFFGPSAEFATLACETGGHYFYYNQSKSSLSFFQEALVPILTKAVYSVKAPLPPFLNEKTGFYRLSGLFVLSFANSVISDSVTLARTDSSTGTRLPFYLPEK